MLEDDTRGDGATDTQIRIETELKLAHIYNRLRYRTETNMNIKESVEKWTNFEPTE